MKNIVEPEITPLFKEAAVTSDRVNELNQTQLRF
jgi:hypothetical protein